MIVTFCRGRLFASVGTLPIASTTSIPGDNGPEDRVMAVKTGLEGTVVHEIDKELGTTAVGLPGICHGHRSGTIRFVGWFVRYRVARSSHTGTGGVTTLDHKTADNPVEDGIIIEAFLHEGREVPRRYRHFWIESDGNVTHGRLQQHLLTGQC